MDALKFPLSKYVIKLILIPSLVTFRSKKCQTLVRFTWAPIEKADLNLYVGRNSAFFSKMEPEKFLQNNHFVDECLPSLSVQHKPLTTRFIYQYRKISK